MKSYFPEKVLPYLLVAPSIIIIIIFLVYPFIQAVWGSLIRGGVWGANTRFVGLGNYTELFTSPDYLWTLGRTFVFATLATLGGMAFSLALAVLLNQRIKGRIFFRTAVIWPYALSPVIAGVLWALLFDPSAGLFTYLAEVLFGLELNWRTNGTLAFVIITVAAAWKNIGYNVVFFLAGLQNVPEQVLESAEVDGASSFQRFWKISIPLISPTIFFLLIMNYLYAFFRTFGLVDVATQGGPGKSTEILTYKLYQDAFVFFDGGSANAQSVLLFVFIVGFTYLQFRYAQRRVFYGT